MAYTYTWTTEDHSSLKREDENGNGLIIPADPKNSQFAEFLDSGATATAYVAPSEPAPITAEDKVNHLLSNYGLTRDELRAVLDS